MIGAATRESVAPRKLLTMRIGGSIWRYTDGPPVEVASGAGEPTRVFAPGLSVDDIGNAVDWAAGPVSARSATVEVVVGHRNVAQEVAGGLPLRSATAELAEWRPGTAWEDREVVLDGEVVRPSYGGAGEGLSFGLVEDPAADRSTMLVETARVSDVTWPRDRSYTSGPAGSDPNVEGAFYPLVFGRPGGGVPLRVLGVSADAVVPAFPMLYVERCNSVTSDDHRWLGAGHRMVATQGVYINKTDGQLGTASWETADDELGQQCALMAPPASGAIPSGESPAIFGAFDWTDDDQAGGLPDPFGPGPLRRADHVIRWAVGNSDVRYDRRQIGRLTAVRGFLLDGMVNAQTAYWPWLVAQVLPLLPLVPVQGPGGLYLAHVDPDVPSARGLADLRVGVNCARASRILAGDPESVVNRVTVAFGPNVATGTMTQTRTVAGTLTALDAASGHVVTDPRCRASEQLFGVRATRIEAPIVYDQSTALAVARSIARRRALPPSSLVLEAGRGLDWLRPGDPVRLHDAGLALDGHPATVGAVRRSGGALELSVSWWPSPGVGP